MLDEDEYERVHAVWRVSFGSARELRERYGLPLKVSSVSEHLRPVCLEYEKITGYHEENPGAVMHHRLSLLGSLCSRCQRPLRTPRAAFCAECGQFKSASSTCSTHSTHSKARR